MNGLAGTGTVKVQFLPVGRSRREWMWKASGDGKTVIAISGQRFDSLGEAVRNARMRIEALRYDDEADGGPHAA
jgi:hypothetical protein